MSRYDGLIIPRSYSEYINKTDAATLSQALQLGGVLDSAPTEDSVNAVKSGGVYDALAGKQPTLTFDNVPTDGSDNPVKSNGIYDALAGKQDTLTFDDTPTASSNNPVKSGGIKNYVDNNIFPDYSTWTTGIDAQGKTLTKNMVLNVNYTTFTNGAVSLVLKVNNNEVRTGDNTASGTYTLNTITWTGYLKKGDFIQFFRDGTAASAGGSFRWYELQ